LGAKIVNLHRESMSRLLLLSMRILSIARQSRMEPASGMHTKSKMRASSYKTPASGAPVRLRPPDSGAPAVRLARPCVLAYSAGRIAAPDASLVTVDTYSCEPVVCWDYFQK
jgi:hypothetical protein